MGPFPRSFWISSAKKSNRIEMNKNYLKRWPSAAPYRGKGQSGHFHWGFGKTSSHRFHSIRRAMGLFIRMLGIVLGIFSSAFSNLPRVPFEHRCIQNKIRQAELHPGSSSWGKPSLSSMLPKSLTLNATRLPIDPHKVTLFLSHVSVSGQLQKS